MSAPNGQTSIAVPGTPLTPDQYKQYALQDPGFLGLQSALQGNEDAYRANARGAINRGVIGLGLAPSDTALNGWLDSGTSDAAKANPLSTLAQLHTLHTDNTRNIQNNLAARGGYDSGELTYGLNGENMRDTQAQSDVMGKFMDYANGLFSQYGTMQAGDAAQLGQELGNAAMRQLALHPGTTTAAQWDDATGTYVDGQGNHYDQYGNHIGTVGDATTNFAAAPGAPITNQGGVAYAGGIPTYQPNGDVASAQATQQAQVAYNNAQANQPVVTQGAAIRGVNRAS